MITLIYGSSATHEMTETQLLDLLNTAKSNNEEVGITGMLLYKGGNFLQVLEGEKEAVESLYNKIRKDPRHKSVMTIFVRPLKERVFGDWKMGFANLDTLDVSAMPEGFSDFMLQSIEADAFEDEPAYAHIFLKNFRDLMR